MGQPGIGSVLLAAGLLLSACEGGSPTPAPTPAPTPSPTPTPTPSPSPVMVASSFAAGFDGWQASYADYTPGQEATIGFVSGHEQLPPPLGASAGVFLASDNRSDDVFMYLWRPVAGLAPNRRYRVEVSVTFATNAPPGCVGIGGAPGESVYLKAGASPREPANVIAHGLVVPNFDKGDQAQSGADAVTIGDFTQPTPGDDCLAPSYQRKTLTTGSAPPIMTSDSAGRLWLVIGTDSGFEGHSRAYLLELTATLTPA
jgi:hypothetical protein